MIVLASASPRRKQILDGLGIEVEVRSAPDEPVPEEGEGARAYALRAARHKTSAVAMQLPGEPWVLGADTVVALDRTIFGKPTDDDDARRMLETLSGRVHVVTTGFCIFHGPTEVHSQTVTTRVVFEKLRPDQIERYVQSGEGRDKAGSYALQGRAMALVRAIDGSYSNVIGLPAAEVVAALENVGAVPAP